MVGHSPLEAGIGVQIPDPQPMKEIYCKSGKMTVQLPDEAWADGPGVLITPCSGCNHKYHNEQLVFMKGEADQAKLINLETTLTNKHLVNVIETYMTGKPEEVVMCTCNCTIHFPTYRSKRV